MKGKADYHKPLFPIGVIATLLRVTSATLRLWEKKGLVRPRRVGKNRYYSQSELDRLKKIKFLLRKRRMNIAGVKDWFQSRCWEVRRCGPKRYRCPVYETRGLKEDSG